MSQAILVVDAQPFTRRLITTTLEDVGQFELHEASDVDEAVEVAQITQPRLVLLDGDMPGLDGVAACQKLRSALAEDDVTIVVLASRRDGFQRRAERAGADIFLTKPFSPLQLLRILGGLERRAQPVRSG